MPRPFHAGLLVLAGLSVLAGCTSAPAAPHSAAGGRGGPVATGSAGPSPAATHTGTLGRYLLPIPAGAHAATSFPTVRGPFAVPDNGALGPAQIAALSIGGSSTTRLSGYGFLQGGVEAWTKGDGLFVLVELIQFSTADLAARYLEGERSVARLDITPRSIYTIDAVPDAATYAIPSIDGQGMRRSYSYTRAGDTVLILITANRAGEVDVIGAGDLVAQQYGRL